MQLQTKPKIILFDIDYTLIDTARLRQLTDEKILLITKLPKDSLEKATKEYAQTLKISIEFSPKIYAQFLANYFNNPIIETKVNAVFDQPSVYRQAIYSETISALDKLKEKHSLGIFSEGIKEFQMAKLILSGLINYFAQNFIFIFPDKTGKAGELVEELGEIYFVDDNPRHIKDIALTPGAHPIWLKRGPKAATEEKLDCPTILSLEELNL